MFKNKIYNYFFNEIFKNFITILLTFSAIAWVIKAINFLDLVVVDGYGSVIYFKYTLLNITAVLSRFIPLSFLLSLIISIIKFERQKEFLILWVSGLSVNKIINIFILTGLLITLLQLILSIFINPYLLNKSRFLIGDDNQISVNTVLRSNDFNASFEEITFFINKKNSNNELLNVFIKDVGDNININTESDQSEEKKNLTILAKRGFIDKNKLILFDGQLQTLNEKNQYKNIFFQKTELTLDNLSTRTIKQAKIQETSTLSLLECAFNQNKNLNLINCFSNDRYNIENNKMLSRRFGSPLYIPLITIIALFLIINKIDKKYFIFNKYINFFFSFSILVFSEIILRYSSSISFNIFYFALPIVLSILFYFYLTKKIINSALIK